MNSKRSYLDNLNAGRPRRPHVSLEDLNRSLEHLESRLDRNLDPGRGRGPETGAAGRRTTTTMGEMPQPAYRSAPRPAARQSEPSFQAIARDIDRVRGQEEGAASIGKISGELKGLRDELRQQMTAGLRREFEALRNDIARAYSQPAATRDGAALGAEFDRLSSAIQTLSERGNDRGVSMLRLELEQVKGALDALAREETLQAVDRRWDDFDKRWSRFETDYAADRASTAEDPALTALGRRLEEINTAVGNLPDSLSLHSLEEKVRTLSTALEHFSSRDDKRSDQMFGLIEERLDEISRAIVASAASANAAQVDAESLERIEARISSLAHQVEELVADRPSAEVIERLGVLSQRVDEIVARSKTPDKAMERLAKHITMIAEKIDNGPAIPDIDAILRGIEERFTVLADAMDRRQETASLQGEALFRDLERRINEVAHRVDKAPPPVDTDQILQELESRFASLAGALDARQVDAREQGAAMFRELELRLNEVAGRIDTAAPSADTTRMLGELVERFNRLSDALERRHAVTGEQGEALFGELEQRLAEVASRIDTARPAADTDQILRELENRFATLSETFDRRHDDVMEHGEGMFRELERRLEQVASRIDDRHAAPAAAGPEIMDVIDARFADLARRLETPRDDSNDAIRNMESKLEDISTRLESSAAQIALIDPNIIRDLETQVSQLSAHLSRPVGPLPEVTDLGPRLDEIERSIASNRISILETARQAAESAVANYSGASSADTGAVAALAEDLKSLETLTRRSDERNTKTFEAIHDTLLKIVDRLASIETGAGETSAPETADIAASGDAAGKVTIAEAPSIAPYEAMSAPEPQEMTFAAAPRRSPAEAAAAAAAAAVDQNDEDGDDEEETSGRKRSMFGGLSRAFAGKKARVEPNLADTAAPAVAAEAEPTVEIDEPLDPKIANRPLEPGSGAPDVNAIMKRVRGERLDRPVQSEPDAGRSDFIAAARRAAQAAAAEAGTIKAGAQGEPGAKPYGFGSILSRKRKSILMGTVAIMVGLAGMQLGKAFFADDIRIALDDLTGSSPAPETVVAEAEQEPIAHAMMASTDPMRSVEPDAPAIDAAPDAADALADEPLEAEIAATREAATRTPDPIAADGVQAPADDSDIDPPVAVAALAPEAPDLAAPAGAVTDQETVASVSRDQGAVSPALESTSPPIEAAPAEVGPLALREAADAGDPKAMFEIGSRYAEGRGVKLDMTAAAKWYERAADVGFAPAQYRIGNFHEKGTGVARDIGKAKTWYQLAAEQGNASAMHNLAVLYAMGADGTPDNDSAARWFIKAAELGVKDSQFNLGILSAKGIGMPQDLEESYKWFALVAKAGDRDAAAKRDEIAKSLRPEQLTHARAGVDQWKPKEVDEAANIVELPEAWQGASTQTGSLEMKKAVATIQMILNKNGYEAGGADGVMGAKTKAAIVAFQKDNGLDPNGEVDDKLVTLLLEKK